MQLPKAVQFLRHKIALKKTKHDYVKSNNNTDHVWCLPIPLWEVVLICFLALDPILENCSNHPSGKIKPIPPAHSHTTVLLISSPTFNLLTQGWLYQGWIHSDMKVGNGSFRHWQVSGLALFSFSSCLTAQMSMVSILPHFSH